MRIINFAAPLGQKAGPGSFNDLDMLEIGNGGMTYDEYVTHFSMWAIVKSPLILGNVVTSMSDETLSIISNEQIISVNQDPIGSPANRVWTRGNLQLWAGSLVNGAVVAVINTGEEAADTSISIADVFVDGPVLSRTAAYKLYDLWEQTEGGVYGKYVGDVRGHIGNVHIQPHQTRVFKLGATQ